MGCHFLLQGIFPTQGTNSNFLDQTVKRLSTMRDTWVRSLGWEDTLEEGMATHSSILSPGESHEQRSLAGYSPWSQKESDAD